MILFKFIYPSVRLFWVLSFLSASCLMAQNESEISDHDLFEKGMTIYEIVDELSFDSELRKIDTTRLEGKIKYETLYNTKDDVLYFALEQFETIVDEYPNSELYHKALFNCAYISKILEFEDTEINFLELLLHSDADDRENSGRNALESNVYANYKHNASNRLADIYIDREAFREALKYKKINKKYPFHSSCGNASAEDKIYSAEQYGKIYLGLGNNEKALKHLLPYIFDNQLADNSDLVNLIIKIFKENYELNQVRLDLEKVLSGIYSKQYNGYEKFYINFLNTEIYIPATWDLNPNDLKKETVVNIVRDSDFYQRLK